MDDRDRFTTDTVIAQIGRMENLLFDLIFRFGEHNNLRTLYTSVLSFIHGNAAREDLERELTSSPVTPAETGGLTLAMARKIKAAFSFTAKAAPLSDAQLGSLLRSYGREKRTTIFVMEPASGRFLATDRALAEHLDFVRYLGGDSDALLRGDFRGTLDDPGQLLHLGFWEVRDESDLMEKLRLLRSCARKLADLGVEPGKPLGFYDTIRNRYSFVLDSSRRTTLGEIAESTDKELGSLIQPEDDEFAGYAFYR
jgi:hypothetical protein